MKDHNGTDGKGQSTLLKFRHPVEISYEEGNRAVTSRAHIVHIIAEGANLITGSPLKTGLMIDLTIPVKTGRFLCGMGMVSEDPDETPIIEARGEIICLNSYGELGGEGKQIATV